MNDEKRNKNFEELNNAPVKTYRAVKTPVQYNEIVRVLTYWGDNKFLASTKRP